MNRNRIRGVTLIFQGLAFCATAVFLWIASCGECSVRQLPFMMIPLLPYAIFAILAEQQYRHAKTRVLPITSAVLSVFFFITTTGVYYLSILKDPSSTAALIFLFWPLYLLVFGSAVLLLAWVTEKLVRRVTSNRS